jgi:hypothetical protein
MRTIDGMLLHFSTCVAGSITPSLPFPFKGESSKESRTLPYQGGGLQGEPFRVAVPAKSAVIGSSGMSAQLAAFMNSSQRR